MYRFNFIYILVSYLLISSGTSFSQSTLDVDPLIEKIKSAQKVEELYTLKYNIDKYSNRENLSIEDQRKINRTYVMLSAAFKSRSHFRNAADVYKDYLKFYENYLLNYSNFCKDSIASAHQKIKNNELNKINELDVEISGLKNTREAVAGLKSKYYSLGSMAAIGIVVLFLVIFITRNRAIRLTQAKLAENREKLISLNKNILDSKLMKGAIAFSYATSVENAELISKIIATESDDAIKKTFSKELQALTRARDLFNGMAK